MYMPAAGEGFRSGTSTFFNVFDLLDEIEYRAIENPDELMEVFRLRYRAYRSRNFIEYRDDQLCRDSLDDEPNNRIFGVYLNGELVSSIRIHLLERPGQQSASMLVFPDILEPKLAAGYRMIDSSRFVVDPNREGENNLLHYITMRIAVLACIHHRADYSLSIVRPQHGAFYRRYFGFEAWGEGRSFPGLAFPVNVYAADCAAMHDKVMRKLPFLASLASERRLLFDREIGKRSCYSVRSTARLAVEAMGRRNAAAAAAELLAAPPLA